MSMAQTQPLQARHGKSAGILFLREWGETRGSGFEPEQAEPKSAVLPLHHPRNGNPMAMSSPRTVLIPRRSYKPGNYSGSGGALHPPRPWRKSGQRGAGQLPCRQRGRLAYLSRARLPKGHLAGQPAGRAVVPLSRPACRPRRRAT